MVLSVCVQPVDIGGFMESEKVREQIEKNKEPPPVNEPSSIKVDVSTTPPSEAILLPMDEIILSPTSHTADVAVSPNSSFDQGSIVWKLNGNIIQTGANSITLDFNTLIATLPSGVYNLIVEGKKNGVLYSSPPITVNIGNPYP